MQCYHRRGCVHNPDKNAGRVCISGGVVGNDGVVPGAQNTGVYANVEGDSAGVAALRHKSSVLVNPVNVGELLSDVNQEARSAPPLHHSRGCNAYRGWNSFQGFHADSG